MLKGAKTGIAVDGGREIMVKYFGSCKNMSTECLLMRHGQ
jgi:hypothetical protein